MKTIRIHAVDSFNSDRFNRFLTQLLGKKYNLIWDQKNPDFLFCFLKNVRTSMVGEHRSYDDKCCKIALTGENVIPDFNVYDYGIGYEYMEFGDQYIRCPLQYTHLIPGMLKFWQPLSLEDAKKRHHFCNFIQSNGKATKDREQFFHLLSRYKHVHSAGKFLRNTDELHGLEQESDYSTFKAREIYRKKFKFTICFENYPYPGYTTEKILNAFLSRTIPIYRGSLRVEEDFMPGSFINVHRFKSLQEVVEEVKRIDNDDDAYMNMLNTHPIPEKYRQDGYWWPKMQSFLFSILDQDLQATRRVASFPLRGRKYR